MCSGSSVPFVRSGNVSSPNLVAPPCDHKAVITFCPLRAGRVSRVLRLGEGPPGGGGGGGGGGAQCVH